MTRDFDKYLTSTREQFSVAVMKQPWNTEFRTKADDLLIAYDQMKHELTKRDEPSWQHVMDEWKKFKSHDPIEYNLGLTYQVKCAEISYYISDADIKKAQDALTSAIDWFNRHKRK